MLLTLIREPARAVTKNNIQPQRSGYDESTSAVEGNATWGTLLMSAAAPTRARPWGVVIASGIANTLGPLPLVLSSLSVFLLPITADTGWPMVLVTGSYSAAAVAMALGLLLVGRAIDRYDLRLVLSVGWVGFTVSTGLMGLITYQPWLFALTFALSGFFGAGCIMPFTRAIVSWFDNKRGLATGVMAAIGGVGTSVTPLLAVALISTVGWRSAYTTMAAISLVVGLAMILGFVRVHGQRSVRGRLIEEVVEDDQQVRLELPGLTFREALRSRHFWLIASGLALFAVGIYSLQVNLVPIMAERGMAPALAATLLSFLGFSSLIGRFLGGVLMDRIHVSVVTAVLLPTAIVGIMLLNDAYASAAIGACLIGLSFGIEYDLVSYYVTRYLGLREYGLMTGIISSVALIGTAFGPMLMTVAHGAFGSYAAVMPLLVGVLALATLPLVITGRFRYPAVKGFDKLAAEDELAAAEELSAIAAEEDDSDLPRSTSQPT